MATIDSDKMKLLGQLIAKTTASSISLLFSMFMLLMILASSDGLQSPYSRIMFFLGIGDVISSLGFILAPHLLPVGAPHAIWAKGNVASCDAIGFFQHSGFTINQLYTVALSYYFLKRVKDKVQPTEFAKKYEKIVHGIIWVIATVPNIIAVYRKDFNPSQTGDFCAFIDNPIDCSVLDDVECIRGENASTDAILFVGTIILTSFLLVITNFVRLTAHVYKAEELMRLEKALDSGEETVEKHSLCKEIMTYFCTCCICSSRNEDDEEEGNEKEAKPKSLAFESFVQSSLWVSVFLLVYVPGLIVFGCKAAGMKIPESVFWIPSIITPLAGSLNIFVYTRPKVQKLRRKFELEHCPYYQLFFIVLLSGGECPKEADMQFTPTPNANDCENVNEKDEFSSESSISESFIQDLMDEGSISNDSFLKWILG